MLYGYLKLKTTAQETHGNTEMPYEAICIAPARECRGHGGEHVNRSPGLI